MLDGLPLVAAEYAIEFAIRYDEAICNKCNSMLITHSFEKHGWKFWCSMCRTPVHRLTMILLDRRGGSGKWIRSEESIDGRRSEDRDSNECDDTGAGVD